jgi:hypothetical protein
MQLKQSLLGNQTIAIALSAQGIYHTIRFTKMVMDLQIIVLDQL